MYRAGWSESLLVFSVKEGYFTIIQNSNYWSYYLHITGVQQMVQVGVRVHQGLRSACLDLCRLIRYFNGGSMGIAKGPMFLQEENFKDSWLSDTVVRERLKSIRQGALWTLDYHHGQIWFEMLNRCTDWLESLLFTQVCQLVRVPTSSENHGKPKKSPKKFHAWKNHGTWKNLNNLGKTMEFCEKYYKTPVASKLAVRHTKLVCLTASFLATDCFKI